MGMKSILVQGFALFCCSTTSLGFHPSGLCFPSRELGLEPSARPPSGWWGRSPGRTRPVPSPGGCCCVRAASWGRGFGRTKVRCRALLLAQNSGSAVCCALAGSGTAPVLPLLPGKHSSLRRLPPPPLPPMGQSTCQAFGHVFSSLLPHLALKPHHLLSNQPFHFFFLPPPTPPPPSHHLHLPQPASDCWREPARSHCAIFGS